MPYTAPEFQRDAFNCPHCDAYAVMDWSQLFYEAPGGGFIPVTVHMAQCGHCGKPSYWIEKRRLDVTDQVDCQMLFPAALQAPMPHSDMPDRVRADYEEARSIVAESPRGAAAILRLAIQRLCRHLGEKGINLNEDIGALVKSGLPVEIQQALDIVRVIGNNAVHPGELSEDDVSGVALTLFELVNQIVEDRIARPKKLQALFDKLPPGARESIAKRDEERAANKRMEPTR